MLVLTRKPGQSVQIGGSLLVTVLKCGRDKVSIGIDAPPQVRIMRAELAAEPSRAGVESQGPSPQGAALRQILIVDDNPIDRELYRRYLAADTNTSYQFIEAESAESALQLLEGATPQCVLLDYRLPDLNGLEFLAEWRKRQPLSRCPVLMLTSFGSEDLADEALRQGACDYLRKGTLSAETLRQRVHRAVCEPRVFHTSA